MQVLIADDHAFQRRTLGRLLKNLGVDTIVETEDGGEALHTLRKGSSAIDLVICDLDMPHMDGM